MKTKRVNISLPTTTLEKLNASIPQGKRSQYITKVLDEDLQDKISLKGSIIRDLEENRWIDNQVMKEWSSLEEEWPEY